MMVMIDTGNDSFTRTNSANQPTTQTFAIQISSKTMMMLSKRFLPLSLTLLLSVTPPSVAFSPGGPQNRPSGGWTSVIRDVPTLLHPPHHHRRRQTSIRTDTALCMGWGPDPIWETAEIASVEAACASGISISMVVNVPPETAAGFANPGQYVQVQTGAAEKPAFLAIASGPDAENARFEFLIKKKDNIEWLTQLKAGDSLQVSQVMGGGYPMEENLEGFKYDFPTQNLLLFAAGSGIAPIASAIESGQLNTGGGRTCRLYYGERTSSDLCFVDRFPAWANAGIEVVPVLSQPEPAWEGREGYVQTVLEEDGISIPRNSGALLCGMKGMTDAVKDLLVKAGVFEGRVLFNF